MRSNVVDNYWLSPNFASLGASTSAPAITFPVPDTNTGYLNYGIGSSLERAFPNFGSQTNVGGGGVGGLWDSLRGWGHDIGLLDGPDGPGWGGFAFDLAKSGLNAYMGMKQFGLYQDALKQSKEQFNKNYAAQRATINAQLEDRQRARVASNPTAYESVGAYMDRHGIKA